MTGTKTDAAPDHSRFPALEGMRGLAVLGVVLTHCGFWTGRYVRGTGSPVLVHADVGVAIFFVLSGFLLSREWFRAEALGRPPARLRAFYWRRGLRILPLYWVTVVIALLAVPQTTDISLATWVRHFTLTQVYNLSWLAQGLTQTWSLCTEAAFYLVLPALAWLTVRLARRGPGLAGAAVIVATALIVLNEAWIGWYNTTSIGGYSAAQWWLPTTISWFAVGLAAAGIQVRCTTPGPLGRWGWAGQLGAAPGVCWLTAAALFLLALTPVTGAVTGGSGGTQQITRNLLYALIALALLWPAVFGASPLVELTLGSRPMRFLGRISYGIFLLHLSILQAATHLLGYRQWTGSVFWLFAMTLALTIPAAAIGYRFVERPAQRQRGRVAAVRPPQAAPPHRDESAEPATT
jgi:peptidoglycan/LPS O-acetylase OafA/YrhL